jgi:hypothetical protein
LSVFGFKSLFFEKGGEGVSYIDFARPWIFDAHGVFLGILRNSMTFLRPLPLKSF